ncbi:hypothetical protein KJ039_07765 [bacterium]|nr:hypothetical protein [bacterium]
MLLSSLLFFGALSVVFGQVVDWDLKNYHFYNPYAFLNGRLGFDYGPAQFQTYLNPLSDLPFYISFLYLKPVYVGFVLGALHGINFWLLYLIGLKLFTFEDGLKRSALSFSSAAAGAFGAGFLSVLGTTLIDSLVAIFVLWSVLLMLGAFEKTGRKTVLISFFLSGLVLGAGVGLKLTQLIYAAGAFMAVLAVSRGLKRSVASAFAWAFGIAAGVLSSSGFWMYMLWTRFESPFFPFFNAFFKSPYFDPVEIADTRFFPEGVIQTLFFPFYFARLNFYLVLEQYFREVRFAVVYILLVLSALMLAHRYLRKAGENRPGWDSSKYLFLAVFFVGSYVIWQIRFPYYRYLIPLELLAPALVVVLLSYVVRSRPWFYLSVAAALIGIISMVKVPDWGRTNWSESYFGLETPPAYIEKNSVVIMAGQRPYSYLIPFFPEDIRFVRVESNFTAPHKNTLYQKEIRELLNEHAGPVYLLVPFANVFQIEKITGEYGMYARKDDCSSFSSAKGLAAEGEDRFILCRLARLPERNASGPIR